MADGIQLKQTRGGYIVAKFNASGFLKLNHSNPLIGANSAGEIVQEMNIVSAEWSVGNNAYWQVQRGANTVLLLTDGQHCFDLSDGRRVDGLGGEPVANVVITKQGSGPGTLILKIHKRVAITPNGSTY